jgi:hypothetical protein
MWRDAQRRERERLWPVVERSLSGLPPRLFDQAKLLEYDLALAYSSSGQFRDIFLGDDQFPALSVGGWLIDDLALVTGARRDRSERHLFLAAVLLAARTNLIASIFDPSSFCSEEHLALVQCLTERSLTELARVVPLSSPFWNVREAVALEELEAMLGASPRQAAPVAPEDPEAYLVPRWSRPARLIGLAALELGRRQDVAAAVNAMLDAVAGAFEIRATLASIHEDLLQGRPTYPIAVVARAAGLPLQPRPDPTVALGALVMTGSLAAIVEAALVRVRDGRRLAVELGLGTFAAYLADVQAAFEADRPGVGSSGGRTGWDGSVAAGSSRPAVVPLVTIARPTLPEARRMAEGYLLADPTFRESWELHREGMFGAPVVASRFPTGLILEILGHHGREVSAEIERFLAFTAGNGFRYFDHPSSDVDTDTIGVYLRLASERGAGDLHAEAVKAILACLERDVTMSGRVPVWIAGRDGRPARPVFAIDLGEGCGTVAAHLLLGLLAYAPERYAETIERGSLWLFDRIVDVGLGANVNYPRPYALAAFGRLAARLRDPALPDLGGPVRRARVRVESVLADELDHSIAWSPTSAQQAALLTIACLDLDRRDRLDPRWTTTILKSQRFDGGWPAESFAAAPNRGRAVTWYSSSLLTSAFCYDAMARAGGG